LPKERRTKIGVEEMQKLSQMSCMMLLGVFVLLSGVITGYAQRPGWLDHTFSNGGATGVVHVIKVQPDGKIIAGGLFSTVNGTTKPNLARLNADGTGCRFQLSAGRAG